MKHLFSKKNAEFMPKYIQCVFRAVRPVNLKLEVPRPRSPDGWGGIGLQFFLGGGGREGMVNPCLRLLTS